MQIAPRIFFDHSRHKLQVRDLKATLDVLAFKGQERLSEPFLYTIEFTSTDLDLGAPQLLGQDARFSLHPPPIKPLPGLSLPEVKPLRTVFGVVSGFKRLWDMHTNGMGAQDDPGEAFKEWQDIMKENKRRQNDKWAGTPYAPLVEFYYGKATLKDID